MSNHLPAVVTVAQAAGYLEISATAVRKAISQRRLTPIAVGPYLLALESVGAYRQTMVGQQGSCPCCGASFPRRRGGQRYCSGICRGRASGRRASGLDVATGLQSIRCEHCGIQFDRHMTNRRFCSDYCRLLAWKAANPERARALNRAAGARWYARHRPLASV